MVIAFDVSTSFIGWCVLSDNSSCPGVGFLNLKKEKSLYKKLDEFRTLLDGLLDKYGNNCDIYVEAPLFGSNNQNVVNLLQRFNGMICAEIYWAFDRKEPTLIANRTALKAAGVKIPKGVKGLDRKKYILSFVQNLGIISEDTWELKRTGNPKDYSYDMADACIVALAGAKNV